MGHANDALKRDRFQSRIDGRAVDLYVLDNQRGLSAAITNYGARLVALSAPDARGDPVDVVLGHPSLGATIADRSTYFGATVGRYANRIAGARFELGGRVYRLAVNDGLNSLHGGKTGFDARVWSANRTDAATVALHLHSADGEEGDPGALDVRVTYALSDDALQIDYEATATADTVVSLTNHAYFNLSGEGSSSIAEHVLSIDAEHTTPVDATLVPTGALAPVAGTPFDFRRPTRIADALDRSHLQLTFAGGIDHNFALRGGSTSAARHVATLASPQSGIVMHVLTTEPGLQVYTGNFLDGSIVGKSGRRYEHRGGLCLETQHFPDSPNQLQFPSTLLRPGEVFGSHTAYRFGIDRAQ